jgi:predicted DCC family thiol-disulfide oxidoreductase YuxK
MPAEPAKSIVLYDGVCGLCNRFVRFVLQRDQRQKFRFASLQGPVAAAILNRHDVTVTALQTVYVLSTAHGREQLLARSDAALFVLAELDGPWRFGAALLRLLPQILRDWGYDIIARNRYRWFGRYETCPLPNEKDRNKFLDLV